jgi:hypothetical protein
MKKLFIVALTATVFIACNSGEPKTAATTEVPVTTETAKPATGQDAELTTWLGGKMMNSTAADKTYDMFDKLKLNADGTCVDKDNNSAKWKVENGEFVFIAAMEIKKKLEKKDETTVVLKGAIQDDAYTLTPIK